VEGGERKARDRGTLLPYCVLGNSTFVHDYSNWIRRSWIADFSYRCYLKTMWSRDVFANGPRVLFFGFVFVTMGLVLLEMRKLRKVFAWSNNSQKYTARRKLFLMMASFVPCAFGTVLILIVIPNTWIYFVGIYLQALQGLANVLSTKERQIISAVSKFSKKICGGKKKSRQATILAPPEFEAGAIQIDPSYSASDGTLPSDADSLLSNQISLHFKH